MTEKKQKDIILDLPLCKFKLTEDWLCIYNGQKYEKLCGYIRPMKNTESTLIVEVRDFEGARVKAEIRKKFLDLFAPSGQELMTFLINNKVPILNSNNVYYQKIKYFLTHYSLEAEESECQAV